MLFTCDHSEETELGEGKLALPSLHVKLRHDLICHQPVDTKGKGFKCPNNSLTIL